MSYKAFQRILISYSSWAFADASEEMCHRDTLFFCPRESLSVNSIGQNDRKVAKKCRWDYGNLHERGNWVHELYV